jgi:hypothetical protein
MLSEVMVKYMLKTKLSEEGIKFEKAKILWNKKQLQLLDYIILVLEK